MPNISTIDDIFKQQARGNYASRMGVGATFLSATAAAAASGFFTLSLGGNAIGSTLPSTITEFPIPSGITSDLINLASLTGLSLNARGLIFLRLYKVGTVTLTATGSQFTHDAATFPVLRSEFGVSGKAQALWPIIQVTTALTTTAAILTFNYVNQTGSSVTGARTFTFPSATTANGSTFFLPLEQGDWAVRDVSNVVISTASATGAATVWLAEEIEPSVNCFANALTADYFTGYGLKIPNQVAATATSGTVTTLATLSVFGASAATTSCIFDMSVLS
jgi:hypothetical protein